MEKAGLAGVLAGAAPSVAVSFTEVNAAENAARARAEGVDVAELRIDQYGSAEPAYVLDAVREFAGLTTLATIRSAAEGGAWTGGELERAELFEAILPLVDGVDVELSATSIVDRVIASAHAVGRPVVVSFHDFTATPGTADLQKIVDEAVAKGADCVKVSAMAHSTQDVRRLAGLLLDNPSTDLIVIAMGAHGAVSRVFFPLIGSRLTYSFFGEPMAPGQLPYGEVAELLARFSPEPPPSA
ncbi:type I 3-dehydroquinate dehydratase [Actinocorallia lasiicapitis]